jgi:intracellular sulfur oxidation DsrE/DsrF family protein
MDRRKTLGALAAAFGTATALARGASAEGEKPHRLVLHVDQNDPDLMNMALNNAGNVIDYYEARGEKVAIEFVTYSQGLHMLREDTSPVKDKIKSLRARLAGVTFSACRNTMNGAEKKEGKPVKLIAEATVVPSGVVRLMELQEQGWSYVRP